MLSIPNQLEGAYAGQDVLLECHTEAYPASINYWTTERGDMIISGTSGAFYRRVSISAETFLKLFVLPLAVLILQIPRGQVINLKQSRQTAATASS